MNSDKNIRILFIIFPIFHKRTKKAVYPSIFLISTWEVSLLFQQEILES